MFISTSFIVNAIIFYFIYRFICDFESKPAPQKRFEPLYKPLPEGHSTEEEDDDY